MKMTRVYDLPTRIFHWLFAGLFLAAFFIAKTYDDDSAVYPLHMMLGMTMVLAVILRILWGFVGSKYARLSSFILNPSELFHYLKSALTSKTKLHLGHNPASSWLAILMIFLALGLGATGILMVQEINKELFEELHELFANAFIVLVIAHIAGIILHTIKHKELISLSMIHGKKVDRENEEGITNNHPFMAILFIAIIGLFAFTLIKNYDQSTRSLNILNKNLQLGEIEEETQSSADDD
ncbi:MAG: cytochrome b/b6 domain-containing protein [Bacteriovorax sp.]|jgi:cytochrome b|nr:cytochrome b/b6 domain-containing protein [Bacteriovorax sp.]